MYFSKSEVRKYLDYSLSLSYKPIETNSRVAAASSVKLNVIETGPEGTCVPETNIMSSDHNINPHGYISLLQNRRRENQFIINCSRDDHNIRWLRIQIPNPQRVRRGMTIKQIIIFSTIGRWRAFECPRRRRREKKKKKKICRQRTVVRDREGDNLRNRRTLCTY